RWCMAEVLGEDFPRLPHPQVVVLHRTGDPDTPAAVPKVSLQLTRDRRDGEGGEVDAVVGVEAFDGQEQAPVADLHQVVDVLAPMGEPKGLTADEPGVALDEHVAQPGVPGLMVSPVE